MRFTRIENTDSLHVEQDGNDIVLKTAADGTNAPLGRYDMVILAVGIEGSRQAGDIARVFDISTGPGNYYVEEHAKLEPVATTTEGIYIAGCGQGPCDVTTAASQAQAAAGKILSRLVPGKKLVLDPRVAEVDEDKCSGCKSCLTACTYKAITFNTDKNQAVINELLCRGCGVCVATCPSAAIIGRHFTDTQVTEEMKALIQG